MLCTDIQIEDGAPERAFVEAWNELVINQKKYESELYDAVDEDNLLKRYSIRQLLKFLNDTGKISYIPYEIMLKTLDHFEIGFGIDGTVEVLFLANEGV